jgi:hypothetical protein
LFQCRSIITLSKGILKYFSIFSLYTRCI